MKVKAQRLRELKEKILESHRLTGAGPERRLRRRSCPASRRETDSGEADANDSCASWVSHANDSCVFWVSHFKGNISNAATVAGSVSRCIPSVQRTLGRGPFFDLTLDEPLDCGRGFGDHFCPLVRGGAVYDAVVDMILQQSDGDFLQRSAGS
jgi:hypothetical protein